MAFRSDPRLMVMHLLKLKGFASADAVAGSLGLDPDEVDPHLKELGASGLALHREGSLTGWSLTPAGRAEHAGALAAEVEQSEAKKRVQHAYGRFLEINPALLATCTAWQLREREGEEVLNDHEDAEYDGRVIALLEQVNKKVAPITSELSACFDRFASYGPRLTTALGRVQAGEHDWFTKPLIDSYHTVWFELHEDLLLTLGLPRGSESPTSDG